MAWYNEIQPDWTEEGTQGMAMMDALKLMSALKGSEMEQLERQANTMKLLGVLGGERVPLRKQIEDSIYADAMTGNEDAMRLLANFKKAERGEMPDGGGAGGLNWSDIRKTKEDIEAIAPDTNWIFAATPEERLAKAQKIGMGYNAIPAKSAAQMWGMPKYPGGPRDEQYNPLEGTDIGRQETNPIVAQLLQRLLAISGR